MDKMFFEKNNIHEVGNWLIFFDHDQFFKNLPESFI